MKNVWSYLFLHGASYASFYGLYLTAKPLSEPRTTLHWSVLILATCLTIFLLVRGAHKKWKESSQVYCGLDAINQYMASWISKPGRTMVLSRDMSWGDGYAAKKALMKKAAAKELTVLVHTKNDLTNELEENGARIVEYNHTGYEPKSRFSIIGFGKEGSQVAVGITRGDDHNVYEFRSGEHPVFAIAEDLTKFLIGCSAK